MIKYTILYKNGKTWNGKAKGVANISVVPCILLVIHCKDGVKKLYCTDGYAWELFEEMNPSHVYERAPNPKSKTKKQKAFDEAYAKWRMANSEGIEFSQSFGGQRCHAYVSSKDLSIKAYKKWLHEQRLANQSRFGRPPQPLKIQWECVYKPWKVLFDSYDYVKTDYTFWLGQDGSVSDE